MTTLVCRVCGHSSEGRGGERCPHDRAVMVVATDLERRPRDRFLGQSINERIFPYAVLGEGGMGVVYEAIQQPMGRAVAVKVIRNEQQGEETHRRRFYREAKIIAALTSVHTPRLFDFGEADGALYMVMELVKGETLADLLRRGPLSENRTKAVALAILDALEEAHRLGLVHRDVKPSNVLVGRLPNGTERVWLLDFGVAKAMPQDAVTAQTVLTATGRRYGTPRYMAPENILHQQLTPRSDLYSLGCVIHECLSGTPPYQDADLVELIEAHVHRPPPPIPAMAGRPITEAAVRALSKDPSHRFTSALAMADAIRSGAVEKRRGSRRLMIGALASAVVVTWAGVGLMLWQRRSEPPPSDPPPVVGEAVVTPRVTPRVAAPIDAGAQVQPAPPPRQRPIRPSRPPTRVRRRDAGARPLFEVPKQLRPKR